MDEKMLVLKSNSIFKHNEQKIIIGKGMPIKNSSRKGNLIINFTIDFPEKIDEKIKTQLMDILPNKTQPIEKKYNYSLYML